MTTARRKTIRRDLDNGQEPGEELYLYTEGSERILWLRRERNGWSLNDANSSEPVGADEDITQITYDWLLSHRL